MARENFTWMEEHLNEQNPIKTTLLTELCVLSGLAYSLGQPGCPGCSAFAVPTSPSPAWPAWPARERLAKKKKINGFCKKYGFS